MKSKLILLALASCAGVAWPANGAENLAVKGRELLKKHQSAVVTVQLVVKSKVSFPGMGGGEGRESKQEVTGTVIDASGLTALSLASTDPSSLLQAFMMDMGDEDSSFKIKMDSELSDVKVLTEDGTELPAEVVLRDRDLDLAFVRPKAKPATPMTFLDLSQSGKVDVLDEGISINRLGRVAGRVYAASVERINAVVQRPRLFYVPGTDKTATGLGCPAFTLDGKLVGLFVMRAMKGGGGGGMFGAASNVSPILLPAEDVKKIAAQVPPRKDEG